MSIRKILQLVLVLVIAFLVWAIYSLISTPIKFDEEKAERSAVVVERIKDIRVAQRAFKSKYGRFTASFDTLINFILTEKVTMERKIVDEDDSVGMANLAARGMRNIEFVEVPVIDTIFSPRKLNKEQIRSLRYIPTTGNKSEYILEAGRVMTESKVEIPVVECRAPYILFLDTVAYRQEIINLIDNDVNNFNKYPGIKFGSMEGGNNEAGNWE